MIGWGSVPVGRYLADRLSSEGGSSLCPSLSSEGSVVSVLVWVMRVVDVSVLVWVARDLIVGVLSPRCKNTVWLLGKAR